MRTCVVCGVGIEGRNSLAKYCLGALCQKARRKKICADYAARNLEKLAERARQFRETHRDQVRQWQRDYYWRDIERTRELNRQSAARQRGKNAEHLRGARREWYQKNKEEVLRKLQEDRAEMKAALKLFREIQTKGIEALL